MEEYINVYNFLSISENESEKDSINILLLPKGTIKNFIKNYFCWNINLTSRNKKIKNELKERNNWKSSIEHYKNKIWHLVLITRLKKDNLKIVLSEIITKNFVTKNKFFTFNRIKPELVPESCEPNGVRCVNSSNGCISLENNCKILDSGHNLVVNHFKEDIDATNFYNLDKNCQNVKSVNETEAEMDKNPSEKEQKKRVKSVTFSNKIVFHYIN